MEGIEDVARSKGRSVRETERPNDLTIYFVRGTCDKGRSAEGTKQQQAGFISNELEG